jgi:L-alanine-DL-glutamate epimerase-like enolase superfamily enzyme
MKFSMHIESWPAARPFRITGRTWTSFDSIVIELGQHGVVGRGEALGVFYADETPATMAKQLEGVVGHVRDGMSRTTLQALLPAGGARNALDCALWDLEAKVGRTSIWELTGITPRALETVYTIGIEATPAAMAAHAAEAADRSLLKVKLDGHQPLERVEAIRRARPDARLVVDANQGWDFAQLRALAPAFADLGVLMIEQPLRRGADAALADYRAPLPLCADESCLDVGELELAAQRYQMINIKLDKTGGLTHGLELAHAARKRGLGLMVGSMAGGSLAMAPAFVVGCLCDFVDIDGPLLQQYDRQPGLRFNGSRVDPPESVLWG